MVAYCRIGERSAHTWFVLHELLGYPNVRNYDGPGPSGARSSACRSRNEAVRAGSYDYDLPVHRPAWVC